jgi:hypothetical protein
VFREIFRACYRRFRVCASKAQSIKGVQIRETSGASSSKAYGRVDEEFVADFCLLGKRHLTPEEYLVFKYYFLLGADWKLVSRQLKFENQRSFFNIVSHIEAKLGRLFREVQPFSLFPLDEYFGGRIEGRRIPGTRVPAKAERRPVQPPIRTAVPVVMFPSQPRKAA